jgi:hypothetical protein
VLLASARKPDQPYRHLKPRERCSTECGSSHVARRKRVSRFASDHAGSCPLEVLAPFVHAVVIAAAAEDLRFWAALGHTQRGSDRGDGVVLGEPGGRRTLPVRAVWGDTSKVDDGVSAFLQGMDAAVGVEISRGEARVGGLTRQLDALAGAPVLARVCSLDFACRARRQSGEVGRLLPGPQRAVGDFGGIVLGQPEDA